MKQVAFAPTSAKIRREETHNVRLDNIQALGRYDGLFVSPHTDDATLSCVGRMLWEKNRGQRVLAVVVFADGSAGNTTESHNLDRLGIDELRLELPAAPRRNPAYGSFAAVLSNAHPDDAQRRASLVQTLDHVVQQTQARHIYLPLGVGGHVDHLLVHEAGSQAIHESAGREIFFFEDRPYSFLPGAIWIRLGQLGARLPPAAHLSAGSGLVQYLLRFQLSPYVRAHATGLADRLRSNRAALRHWMDARGWHPRKACGPRLQPIEHPLEPAALDVARELLQQHSQRMSLCTSAPRVRSSRRTAGVPRLKRRDETERYWLLLPSLERDLALPEDALPIHEPDRAAQPAIRN
jgi:LmbE family N-acetylglucosaminyl deacetylase